MRHRQMLQTARERLDARQEVASLRTYLEDLVSGLHAPTIATADATVDPTEAPERVFDVLTRREFCYLSKGRVAPYKAAVLSEVAAAQDRGGPIPFFYDLGGGYHASTRPGQEGLSFDVGLAELFVLRQIRSFSAKIARLHAPGVRFTLVLDNMCALLINDIPLALTLGYCAKLRGLIREFGFADMVDVLVESEHVSVADFERDLVRVAKPPGPIAITRKQHDNVERFLGRSCDEAEAFERTRRYHAVIDASERLLAPLIAGIHMTQRATDVTICFRPFPGADSRIQCGEVVLTTNHKQELYPMLMTSSNRPNYALRHHRFPDLLSPAIARVTYAEPVQIRHWSPWAEHP